MYDYHSHSFFSDDSVTPMDTMIEAAIARGLVEYAITDHYDPDYPNRNYSSELDFDKYFSALEEASHKYKDRIKIVKGLEIGIQLGETIKKCCAAAGEKEYDFLLGSFHAADGMELDVDFFLRYTPEEGIRRYYDYVLEGISLFSDFDVLGHINVVDRYTDYLPPYTMYMDQIAAILKKLMDRGKGIEFNTSSFRYGMGSRTTPSLEILKLYKELGGEVITLGSDAHSPKYVAEKFDLALEILSNCGFKYITVYEKRKAAFIPIDKIAF